jgi:hypothetical protein
MPTTLYQVLQKAAPTPSPEPVPEPLRVPQHLLSLSLVHQPAAQAHITVTVPYGFGLVRIGWCGLELVGVSRDEGVSSD